MTSSLLIPFSHRLHALADTESGQWTFADLIRTPDSSDHHAQGDDSSSGGTAAATSPGYLPTLSTVPLAAASAVEQLQHGDRAAIVASTPAGPVGPAGTASRAEASRGVSEQAAASCSAGRDGNGNGNGMGASSTRRSVTTTDSRTSRGANARPVVGPGPERRAPGPAPAAAGPAPAPAAAAPVDSSFGVRAAQRAGAAASPVPVPVTAPVPPPPPPEVLLSAAAAELIAQTAAHVAQNGESFVRVLLEQGPEFEFLQPPPATKGQADSTLEHAYYTNCLRYELATREIIVTAAAAAATTGHARQGARTIGTPRGGGGGGHDTRATRGTSSSRVRTPRVEAEEDADVDSSGEEVAGW